MSCRMGIPGKLFQKQNSLLDAITFQQCYIGWIDARIHFGVRIMTSEVFFPFSLFLDAIPFSENTVM